MYILSFKDGHDPAACLLKDGAIVAAAEEERFTRVKHAPFVFPEKAIRFCLKQAGIREEDVDYVIYARRRPWKSFFLVSWYFLKRPPLTRLEWRFALSHMKTQVLGTVSELLGKARYQKIKKLFPGLPKRIHDTDHHLGHAASAFYFSGFDSSLILTMDGKGEATSVAIWEGKGTEIRCLERRGFFESLGMLYSAFTKHLGFTPNDGEYKVMGLAPAGTPNMDFSDILAPDQELGYRVNTDFELYPISGSLLARRFGIAREKESPITQEHKDLAASLQDAFEKASLSFVRYAKRKMVGCRQVCLAGGVALNVKMNKAIWESGEFDSMFVQPAAGDDGLVLGAAALHYVRLTGKIPEPIRHMYFGPGFEDEEIREAFDRKKIRYHRHEDVTTYTANLLAQGNVIGWFQGRMEFGPRALGHRSVLANPSTKEMQEIVNAKIKFRESFRPFCPSILAEAASLYFERYTPSAFMVMSFAVNDPDLRKKIPAVVHVDGTVRPQGVEPNVEPLYHRLLQEFEKLTNIPAVLNTSMNVRGEPIVCTPDDLIDFFAKTHVDAVVAGPYVALRAEQDESVLSPMTREQLVTEY